MIRHIDPVDRCTFICTTIHELETTSDRWILDEFGFQQKCCLSKTILLQCCDESLILMTYSGSLVVGYK
jgi:hypothetical protein